MEARGEIRGGRFVAGISGEQFALAEAIGTLRKVRNKNQAGELVVLSSADPLNLVGILVPGDKIAVSVHTKIIFKEGLAIAVQHKNELRYLSDLDEETRQQVRMKGRVNKEKLQNRVH
jgi:ATP-dependent Lhr-like helicase